MIWISLFYQCYNFETLFEFAENLMYQYGQAALKRGTPIPVNSTVMDTIWDITNYYLYERGFYPLFQSVQFDIHNSMTSSISLFMTISYIIIGLVVCIVFFNLYQTERKKKEFYFAISLLLHFPHQILLQVPGVTQLLSGNFRDTSFFQNRRDDFFYESLIDSLPEGILIATLEGKIINQNKSSMELLHLSAPFKTLSEFFSYPLFNGTAENFQHSVPAPAVLDDDTRINIVKNVVENMIVFTLTDVTVQVQLNEAITQQEKRIGHLLYSLLPCTLR